MFCAKLLQKYPRMVPFDKWSVGPQKNVCSGPATVSAKTVYTAVSSSTSLHGLLIYKTIFVLIGCNNTACKLKQLHWNDQNTNAMERHKNKTSMHSSRMRTTRSSSRLVWGGVCLSACWGTPSGVGLETPVNRITDTGKNNLAPT